MVPGRDGMHSDAGVEVDTVELDQVARRIRDLGSVVSMPPWDRGMVTGDVVGHAGIAAALREFLALWEDRLREFEAHVDQLGAMVHESVDAYHGTDVTTAEHLGAVVAVEPGKPEASR